MSVDRKLDAKFGVNRARRSLALGAVELDCARSARGQVQTFGGTAGKVGT